MSSNSLALCNSIACYLKIAMSIFNFHINILLLAGNFPTRLSPMALLVMAILKLFLPEKKNFFIIKIKNIRNWTITSRRSRCSWFNKLKVWVCNFFSSSYYSCSLSPFELSVFHQYQAVFSFLTTSGGPKKFPSTATKWQI